MRTLLGYIETRDEQLHLFVTLAAVTGARRAQLLGLRWHNVHLDTHSVSFCAGWVEGPHGPVLAATKTRRNHAVDLDPTTCTLLARRANDRGGPNDGFVFSDDRGLTAWKPNRVTKAFIRYRRGRWPTALPAA
ncbi:MAG TPA: hypothetical protein VFI47_08535 [Acidimicrobiales bacterium]|nr:hypothetical protein [Acidimicrobiales bacterium]